MEESNHRATEGTEHKSKDYHDLIFLCPPWLCGEPYDPAQIGANPPHPGSSAFHRPSPSKRMGRRAVMSVPSTSYDELPYDSLFVAQSHPDRLAAMAVLFGLEPPPVERCRVLELGCAEGANLLAMAQTLPGGTFVGVDLSARQVADGRAVAEEL